MLVCSFVSIELEIRNALSGHKQRRHWISFFFFFAPERPNSSSGGSRNQRRYRKSTLSPYRHTKRVTRRSTTEGYNETPIMEVRFEACLVNNSLWFSTFFSYFHYLSFIFIFCEALMFLSNFDYLLLIFYICLKLIKHKLLLYCKISTILWISQNFRWFRLGDLNQRLFSAAAIGPLAFPLSLH